MLSIALYSQIRCGSSSHTCTTQSTHSQGTRPTSIILMSLFQSSLMSAVAQISFRGAYILMMMTMKTAQSFCLGSKTILLNGGIGALRHAASKLTGTSIGSPTECTQKRTRRTSKRHGQNSCANEEKSASACRICPMVQQGHVQEFGGPHSPGIS